MQKCQLTLLRGWLLLLLLILLLLSGLLLHLCTNCLDEKVAPAMSRNLPGAGFRHDLTYLLLLLPDDGLLM